MAKKQAQPKTVSDTKTKSISKSKPSKTASAPTSVADNRKTLDLCLLMDCTSSMQEWIDRCKNHLNQIIDNFKAQHSDMCVRVSFVGYRDILDTERFCVKAFTEDLTSVKQFISKVVADGGRDWPEDVQGGLNKALQLDWKTDSTK